MDDKWFALITVLVSGLFSLVVALIVSRQTSKRENATFRREASLARLERVQELFEDIQLVLVRVGTMSKKESGHELDELRISARLNLDGDDELNDLFAETAFAYNKWLELSSQGPVQRHEGLVMIRSERPGDKLLQQGLAEAEEKAKDLHLRLTKKMRDRLAAMRKELNVP